MGVMKGLPRGVCLLCGVGIGKGKRAKRYCERCRTICPRCGVAPRVKDRAQCLDCKREYDRKYAHARSEEARLRTKVRKAVNDEIKRGRRERQPCVVCESPNSLILVTNAKRGEVTFVCKQHHKQVAEFYGRVLSDIRMEGAKTGRRLNWNGIAAHHMLQSQQDDAEKPPQTAIST